MWFKDSKKLLAEFAILMIFILIFFAFPAYAKAESQVRYINQYSRVRDLKGNPVGYKNRGDRIIGNQKGSYFQFYENGSKKQLHKSLVTPYPLEATAYVKGLTNVRSMGGQVIGQIRSGGHINGVCDDRFIYFDYMGKKAKIYKSTANIGSYKIDSAVSVGGRKKGLKSLYVTGTSNVRDIHTGKVIDVKYRGENIIAYRSGNYYYFQDDGKVKKIYYSLLTSAATPGEFYTSTGVNVRRISDGSKIGYLSKWKRTTGIVGTDYTYILYNGSMARIYSKYTGYKKMARYYAKEDVNIRDVNGRKLGVLAKGESIYGERVGDYYRYAENGKYRFVWHSYMTTKKVTVQDSGYEEYIVNKYSKLLYASSGNQYRSIPTSIIVSAKTRGSYLYFTYEGRDLKVLKSKANSARYLIKTVKSGTNIRDLDLKKIYNISSSKKIKAYRYDSKYYLFFEGGQGRLVHDSRIMQSSDQGDNPELEEIIRMVLDPGHGEGKAHNRGGLIFNEGDQNYEMSQIFAKEASKYMGLETINTRNVSSDNPILSKRAEIGRGANIFISLHTNAAGSSARGVEIYGSMNNKETQFPKEMAEYISDTLNTPNRGVKYRTYDNSILRNPSPGRTDYWGVFRGNSAEEKYLIEFVFHTNYQDSKSLIKNRDKLVKGLVEMIANHFNLVKIK